MTTFLTAWLLAQVYAGGGIIIWLALLGMLNVSGRTDWIIVCLLTFTWPVWLIPAILYYHRHRFIP